MLQYQDYGLFAVIIAIFGVIIGLMSSLQKPLTTQQYVINTYVYILLAILICAAFVLIIDKYQFITYNDYTSMKLLAVFIITIIVMTAMFLIDRKQVLIRHILWIAFLIGISIMVYPTFEVSKDSGTLLKIFATIIIIVGGLTFVASKFPANYFNSWGSYLTVGLLGLIIFEILDLIFSNGSSFYSRQKIYSIIAIVLFSGFILYDTKKIYQHADISIASCTDLAKHLQCADYLGESLGLFLDILNLFTSFSNIYNN